MRLLNAARYSLAGLYHALKHEQAFTYEFVVLVFVCIAVCVVQFGMMQKIFAVFAWLIVMCLELVNSAVEKTLDIITKDYNPEIKAAKDMLSGSVFIAVCFNIILWVIMIIYS